MSLSWKLRLIVSSVAHSFPQYQRGLNKVSDSCLARVRYSSSVSARAGRVQQQPRRRLGLLVGVLGGAAAGAGYGYYRIQQARTPLSNDGTGSSGRVLTQKPDTPVSRSIVSPTDDLNLKLVLYQYQTCPFCCKVRTFLDFYGFSYDVIEVNPVLRQQIKWSDYRKVPILLAKVEGGYQQLNDSSMIVSALASFLHDRGSGLGSVVSCYPSISFKDEEGAVRSDVMNKYFLMFQGDAPKDRTKEDLNEERKWRKWADDVLVHMLSPNVYRTRQEAMQAFNWFSEVGEWEKHFPAWERQLVIYVGALAMWVIGKRLKKRHNLKEDVRESLYDACHVWVAQLEKQNSEFQGGSSPNLADLAVFGVLNSIEGCDAFGDILQHTDMGPWYSAMKLAVITSAGSAALGAA